MHFDKQFEVAPSLTLVRQLTNNAYYFPKLRTWNFSDRVQALCYASATKSLFSAANDTSLVIWDMGATRQEVSEEKFLGISLNIYWKWRQ